MAIEPIIFTAVGDPAAVVAIAGQQLANLGYTITLGADRWSGEAEVGSKVGRVLAGGFVRRMKVTYAVTQGYTDGQWVLTISPGMSGMGGGALGVSKSKKEMTSIYESVAEALARHGHVAAPQGIQRSSVEGQPAVPPAPPIESAPPFPPAPSIESAPPFPPAPPIESAPPFPTSPPTDGQAPPAGGGNPW